MAGFRGKMLVEMALKGLQHDNTETENAVSNILSQMGDVNNNTKSHYPEPDTHASSSSTNNKFDYNNNIDIRDVSDDLDFDDDVRDPDWTPKRKRDECSSSDSELDSDDHQDFTFNTDIMNETSVQNPEDVEVRNSVDNVTVDQNVFSLDIEHEEVVVTSGIGSTIKSKSGFKQNKLLRMQGEGYRGYCKDDDGKSRYCTDRSERVMSQRCCTNRCFKGWGGRKCQQVDENTRSTIFSKFWKELSWCEKKVYVLSLVTKKEVNRRTKGEDDSRRKYSYSYHLRVGDSQLIVCKALFLATLSLKEDTVYNWLAENGSHHGIPNSPPTVTASNAKTKAKESAIKYLKEVPKMPSHYCRARTAKLYLETDFSSLSELYKHYRQTAETNIEHAYGITQFTKLFREMNLAFYKPKKDQCDLCTGFKVKTINDEIYKDHIRRKTEASEAKRLDKEEALNEGKMKVITMDLQSLLLCPKLEASCLFYKTKLCCHNFTLFDLTTKSVMCYFWNETAADLGASTFASCIIDYLESLNLTGLEKVVLYSDGCTYQNRNSTLSCALLQFAVANNIEIEQKFLEKGHTYLECDSVHATIGRKIKKKDVFIPQQYVELIKESREGENPYKVKYIDHSFFKDYSTLQYYSSIRPGHGVGSPVVTDIRVLKYTTDGKIMFKLNYSDKEFGEIRKPRNSSPSYKEQVHEMYTKPVALKSSKYRHLQQIKEVIPKDYHSYYDNLTHE